MATIAEIINLVSAGATSVLGTGTKGFRPSLKKVTTLWLLSSGFKLDKTRVLDEDYVGELQESGDLIVVKGIRAFTDNSEEDQNETLEDGTMAVTRLGLYSFAINFINGMYFHAALHSLSGFSNYDILMIDRDGSVLGTESSDGSIKGFTVGMLQADKLTFASDTTAAREGLRFQLLDRAELDKEYAFIHHNELDFNPNRVEGINEVLITYPSVPADAATTFAVKAVRKQDRQPVTGLVVTNFLVTKGGATITPTGVAEVNGVYTFTVDALATNDELAVQLYTSAGNTNVVTLDQDKYKSNEATATVV